MKLIRRFLPYYRPFLFLFWSDMACAFLASVIDLAFPVFVRSLMNDILPNATADTPRRVLWIGLWVFLLYGVRMLCQYYITSWGHIMGARMEKDMRRDLFARLSQLPFSFYDDHNTGKLMSRMTTDLFDISELAHHGPEDLFISALKIIGALGFLVWISPPLTGVLALFLVVITFFSIHFNRKMRAVFQRNREKIALVNAQVQDSLAGIRVVQSFSNETVEQEKFAESNQQFQDTKEDSYNVMGWFFSGSGFLQGVLYLCVLVGGGLLIATGRMPLTDLVTYLLFVGIILNPIDRLINFTEGFQRGMSGFERFLEIIDTEPAIRDREGAKPLDGVTGRITFENVSFSYNEQTEVLKGLDLDIEPGRTVALVGPSGGGKTTFCNLIPRFYEVTEGCVRIDGTDVRDVTLASLRTHIGLVQQDVYLFGGTIRENIAYGRTDASQADIEHAARLANAHDFIMGLEKGYDTFVGERGVKLSGGQKQRVSIARAFLKNPSVLILDEATSALDNESERLVQQSLATLAKGRTTLIIAHRLSTIRSADLIVVLTENGIAEKGTHDELIRAGGVYANLHLDQAAVV